MLEWSEFVEKLKDDINRYCKQNKINFDESISYLKSFIEKEDNYSEKGLNESFILNFIKIYDSSIDINDKRNCIDRLTRYEPFLRKICFMRFPDKISEIENLCAAELIKRLELIEDKNFWDKNNNDYPSNSFAHHLFIMYMAKNSSSHHWEKLNERELYEMRYTIAIFYIEVISKLQNILRAASCLPEETVEYYARYIDKNGIPYGIRKLTEEQVKHKNSSYKFIIKEKQLKKIIHINSLGNPYEYDGTFSDPVIQEISYLDENTIKIKCTNSTGKKINLIKEYKRDSDTGLFNRLNYYKGDSNSSYHLLNDELNQYLQGFNVSHTNSYKANISSIKLERNKDGFVIKERFLRYHGENILQSDKDNNYGYEYEINTNGLITKKFFLDKNGKKKKCAKGICFEEIKYNSLFEKEEVSIHNRYKDSKYIYKYDDFGNLVQSTVFSGNKRTKKLKLIYNSLGQRTGQYFFNENGLPDYCYLHFHRDVRTYDENGYFASAELYGINKNEKVIGDINGSKCWKIVSTCNNFGFETSEEYYDCDGNPILGNAGSFRIEYDYDEAGNKIEERYY